VVAIFHLGEDETAARPSAPQHARARHSAKVKHAAKTYLSDGNAALDWAEF
jgi:hypothetical protein